MDITRPHVLAVIRRCQDNLALASNDDERMLLAAGLMPRDLLLTVFKASAWTSQRGQAIEQLLDELVLARRLIASRSYLKANPKDRIRPIYSEFDLEKPTNIPPRSKIHVTVSKRDRLALWYAAANHDLSGSQNYTTAIFLLLQFWRLPRIQKAWRTWIGFKPTPFYKGSLPKDAQ